MKEEKFNLSTVLSAAIIFFLLGALGIQSCNRCIVSDGTLQSSLNRVGDTFFWANEPYLVTWIDLDEGKLHVMRLDHKGTER